MKFEDLTKRKFGRLTVKRRASKNSTGGRVQWVCKCECGKIVIIIAQSLIMGRTKSCGCLLSEVTTKRLTKHGKCKHPDYWIWQAMWQRCTNKKKKHYKSYGARGISVCKRWRHFDKFLEDMGPRPVGYVLDRHDNDGNYEPSNCSWVSKKRSARNTRRAIIVTVNGRTQCLADWADELGIRYRTIYYRIYSCGWTPEKAVTTPVKPKSTIHHF